MDLGEVVRGGFIGFCLVSDGAAIVVKADVCRHGTNIHGSLFYEFSLPSEQEWHYSYS